MKSPIIPPCSAITSANLQGLMHLPVAQLSRMCVCVCVFFVCLYRVAFLGREIGVEDGGRSPHGFSFSLSLSLSLSLPLSLSPLSPLSLQRPSGDFRLSVSTVGVYCAGQFN